MVQIALSSNGSQLFTKDILALMPRTADYFSTESVQQDLKGKSVRGGVWTALAQAICMVIQIITIPLLTRPLDQSDFGLIGMAAVFTGFAAMFVDSGMTMAVIQRKEINHGQVSNLFWLSSSMGLVMALVSAATAPLVAWFYQRPELMPLVMAMSVPFIFAGMTTQHRALMTRSMRFRQLAVVQVSSTFLARVLTVYLAWEFRTYWALAVGQIARPLLAMIFSWALSGWRPGLPRRGSGVRPLVAFGANLTGFYMINYFARNADNLLIGKFWGADQVGAYDRAYQLFMMPIRRARGPLGTVAVPALSRLVDQPDRYRSFFLSIVRKLALVGIPAAMFLLSAADIVIPGYLGAGWETSIPILRALSIVGIFQAVGTTTGWLYVSHGHSNEMLGVSLITVPILVLSFLLGLPWGASGVAVAYAIAVVIVVFPMQTVWACRNSPIHLSDFLLTMRAPFGVGAFVAAGVVVARLMIVDSSPQVACQATLVCGVLAAGWGILMATPEFSLGVTLVCGMLGGAFGLAIIPAARAEIQQIINLRTQIAPPAIGVGQFAFKDNSTNN